MSAGAAIRAARQLIADEANWTQDANARDELDEPIRPEKPEARSFDMLGALQKVCDLNTRQGRDDYFAAAVALKRWLPKGSDLFSFNDDRGHAEVLKLMDRAAEDPTEAAQPVPKMASVSSILRRLAPYQAVNNSTNRRNVA